MKSSQVSYQIRSGRGANGCSSHPIVAPREREIINEKSRFNWQKLKQKKKKKKKKIEAKRGNHQKEVKGKVLATAAAVSNVRASSNLTIPSNERRRRE